MKREEKNQQTRRRIMDSALTEFSKQGYGASSVNAICAVQNISKGIIYHYFNAKDDLFLACVEECFTLLTNYLKETVQLKPGEIQNQLTEYFTARSNFFRENPVYQRIFCEAIITPPAHLRAEIQKRRQVFDTWNTQILEYLLEQISLCPQFTKQDVIETFRQFQDFMNAKYQFSDLSVQEFETHEVNCRKALNILLYGVVKRGE
ncbi:MAG: TetR/AcrR family transcriptional regulator [Clostridia bacterium]|nr:TetR/AcrR family transcriptional regulator [Clostridia bacterium]